MTAQQIAQGCVGSGVGLTLATQLYAFQAHYSQGLGPPIAAAGLVKLYAPWQGLGWAWQWLHAAPETFLGAGAVWGALTVGAIVTAAKGPPPAPGGAEWATRRQVRQAGLFRPSGVVLGRWGRRIVRHLVPSHVLAVASTQSGKTTSLVADTILDDTQHSMLILDPKDEGAQLPGGELYQMTAGYRATMSKVIRFQPLSAISHQYNPLQSVRLGTPYEIRDLQIVADMLTDPDGGDASQQSESSRHFMGMAADVHTGVLAHGLYTRTATSLGDFYRLWCGPLSLADLVATMATTRHENGQCHPSVLQAVRLIKETADRELSSLLNTARRALRLWADPLVCRATARSDFTLKDLREGVRPLSLYCSFPFSDIERLRPLSRLLIRQCLEYAASRKTGWRWPLMAMLDEFQSLRRLPILRHGLNYFLGMGVTMCLITPSLNEVTEIWGPHHPFLEGCATKVVFGVRDAKVAARFSETMGMTQTEHTRESTSDGPTRFTPRHTTSTETRDEPLISSTAVLGLKPDEVLAKVGPLTLRLGKAWYRHNRLWKRRSLLAPPAPKGQP